MKKILDFLNKDGAKNRERNCSLMELSIITLDINQFLVFFLDDVPLNETISPLLPTNITGTVFNHCYNLQLKAFKPTFWYRIFRSKIAKILHVNKNSNCANPHVEHAEA